MRKYTKLAALLLLSVSSSVHAAGAVEFGYEGDIGPEFWHTLSPDYALCGSGQEQSPIDIRNEIEQAISPLSVSYSDTELNVVNNGHTLQVNVPAGLGSLEFDGKIYELKQFHYHTPSEHTKNGRAAPMEVHYVHVSDDGQIAVIGAFMKKGGANATFGKILQFAPTAKGEIVVPEQSLNVRGMLPSDLRGFYHYNGSLTTPPCSEGLKWFVIDNVVSVSDDQISQFKSIFHGNARPVQDLNERVIIESLD